MKVGKKHYKTLWMNDKTISLINQNVLPFSFEIITSNSHITTCKYIKDMNVRGAGAIGVCAGFAMAQAALEAPVDKYNSFIDTARAMIENTRPTARNLFYATEQVYVSALISPQKAYEKAQELASADEIACKKIGFYGNEIIKDGMNIETHCNAGWLAFVDYGSALSPIYIAHEKGKKIHVWVDETAPRRQGARLTAWELTNQRISNTIIADNAGAYLMINNRVDMMIVGADRIAANGDIANKIGTLEKAIIAYSLGIPFYVAAPISTFDFNCNDGKSITIEERHENEILYAEGLDETLNEVRSLKIASPGTHGFNPAFDVTPAKYITGIITEAGIIKANSKTIEKLKF